ncbi:hypothetical protein [Mobiluncus mulieris]|uniref:hypothetical protein n=1 Tax=Mobiluncus mulieris TaxID=2052 RepID=UPI000B62C9BB|nr:hypothetical protein [Mobiluncus mulieris]
MRRLAARRGGTRAARVAGLSVLVECLGVSASGGFALLALFALCRLAARRVLRAYLVIEVSQ